MAEINASQYNTALYGLTGEFKAAWLNDTLSLAQTLMIPTETEQPESYKYNEIQYNGAQYGSYGFDYAILLADNLTVSDDLTKFLSTILSDSVTSADTLVKTAIKPRYETVFVSDALTKSITGKILTESVRLAAWLITKRGYRDEWSD